MSQMKDIKQRNFVQAAKSIAFAAASLLGSNKSVKCIVDSDKSFELTSSSIKLLRTITIEHPAISIIYDVCQGLHKHCGTGCSTLVFMTGSWLQSFENLSDQGIPLPILHLLFDDALDLCLKEVTKNSISIKDLNIIISQPCHGNSDASESTRSKLPSLPDKNSEQQQHAASGSGKFLKTKVVRDESMSAKKLMFNKYSRHSVDDFTTENQSDKDGVTNRLINQLCIGVSRGNSLVARLLEEVLRLTLKTHDYKYLVDMKISTDDIITQIITNESKSNSFVFEGICLSMDAIDVDYFAKCVEGKPVRICLLDFDQMSHSAKQPDNFNMNTSKQPEACRLNVDKLLLLKVSCVIVKGGTTDFIEECQSCGIITLRIFSYNHLKTISFATGSCVVASPDELDESDIGSPVRLSMIRHFQESLSPRKDKKKATALIAIHLSDCDVKATTVVICATTSNMAQLQEEAVWRALCKLRNILDSGTGLVGGGDVEAKCAKKLRCCEGVSQRGKNSTSASFIPRWISAEADLYRSAVYAEVAQGLDRYCSQLHYNCNNRHSEACDVLDDVLSKTEAWKRAMKLVKSISRIDMVITTGISEQQESVF